MESDDEPAAVYIMPLTPRAMDLTIDLSSHLLQRLRPAAGNSAQQEMAVAPFSSMFASHKNSDAGRLGEKRAVWVLHELFGASIEGDESILAARTRVPLPRQPRALQA